MPFDGSAKRIEGHAKLAQLAEKLRSPTLPLRWAWDFSAIREPGGLFRRPCGCAMGLAMQDGLVTGRDIYVRGADMAFGITYEESRELFYRTNPDGTPPTRHEVADRIDALLKAYSTV